LSAWSFRIEAFAGATLALLAVAARACFEFILAGTTRAFATDNAFNQGGFAFAGCHAACALVFHRARVEPVLLGIRTAARRAAALSR
jgi:hypothetical protein